MRKWTSVLALAVVGALIATMAVAQTGGGSSTAPTTSGAKQSGAGGSSASPSTSGTGADTSTGQALKNKGHDPGAIDGVMGAKTRSALRDFQKKEGIKDTGRLDQETMSKLGVEGSKTSSGGPSSTGTSASPATSGSATSGDSSSTTSGSTSGTPSSTSGSAGTDKK